MNAETFCFEGCATVARCHEQDDFLLLLEPHAELHGYFPLSLQLQVLRSQIQGEDVQETMARSLLQGRNDKDIRVSM